MKRIPENLALGPLDTPVLPECGYRVHDGTRPQPRRVAPGSGPGDPPADAIVLFAGGPLDQWESLAGGPAGWRVVEGAMEVVPGAGNIRTRRSFGDVQLHLEFRSPPVVKGTGQGRGNSGVFLMGLYEVQVLDNHENPTYADGTVGALYGQCPPLANAIRGPGEWNAYDILWEAPVFQGAALVAPAFITVLLNGVVLHHRHALLGRTAHKILPVYEAHPPTGPLMLQDHGDLVRFRNVWIREPGRYDV